MSLKFSLVSLHKSIALCQKVPKSSPPVLHYSFTPNTNKQSVRQADDVDLFKASNKTITLLPA